MSMYPLFTTGAITSNQNYLYAIGIGMLFGFILERAGFGRATHIAPVFYFRNLMVSKTMVNAILTAAFLITLAVYNGWVDYNQIFIPKTYVWPYVVGGALFGLGMVMSGWCPGTAVIGLAKGKIDAVAFLAGVMVGMFVYFDVYDAFDQVADFANSSYIGRFTIDKLIGGNIYTSFVVTIFLGIGMAVFMHTMKAIQEKKAAQEKQEQEKQAQHKEGEQ